MQKQDKQENNQNREIRSYKGSEKAPGSKPGVLSVERQIGQNH